MPVTAVVARVISRTATLGVGVVHVDLLRRVYVAVAVLRHNVLSDVHLHFFLARTRCLELTRVTMRFRQRVSLLVIREATLRVECSELGGGTSIEVRSKTPRTRLRKDYSSRRIQVRYGLLGFIARPIRSQSYRPPHEFSAERRPFCSYVRTLQLVSFLSRFITNIHSPLVPFTNYCHAFGQSGTTFRREICHFYSLMVLSVIGFVWHETTILSIR